MTTKHTAGPWKAEVVKGWGDDLCITSAEASKPIFKAIKPDAYYTDFPEGREPGSKILSTALAEKQGRYVATPEIRKRLDEQEEANARLAASAPELLEALQRIQTAASATWCNPEWIAQHAKEAIAKATGEQA